jgi:hypothetical protein
MNHQANGISFQSWLQKKKKKKYDAFQTGCSETSEINCAGQRNCLAPRKV